MKENEKIISGLTKEQLDCVKGVITQIVNGEITLDCAKILIDTTCPGCFTEQQLATITNGAIIKPRLSKDVGEIPKKQGEKP